MRKEYDLKKLKVKRRGILPGVTASAGQPAKVRITIALDEDVVEHFKSAAEQPGALPYQTQINQALRRAMGSGETGPETVKSALLTDENFLRAVARKISAGNRG